MRILERRSVMNIYTKIIKPNKFEKEIDAILEELQYHEKDSQEYAQILSQLEKLVKMQDIRHSRRIKPDTLAQVGANLGGIALILNYEKLSVITTKALNFVVKGRL